jgi:signal transduction histidine kinase
MADRQMNAAGEKLWGVTAQSLVDWNLLEMDESLAPMDEIRRAFTGAVVTIPPYRYRTKQVPGISTTGVADDKWIGCVFYPVFDEAGRLEEVVCIHEDATARWQAEEKIRRMNAELERRILERTTELAEANVRLHRALEREQELGRLKSNFVSLVSHEFRTPLGIILSSSEILQQYLSTLEEQERQEQLEAIKTNVLRMSSLMERGAFLQRPGSGQILPASRRRSTWRISSGGFATRCAPPHTIDARSSGGPGMISAARRPTRPCSIAFSPMFSSMRRSIRPRGAPCIFPRGGKEWTLFSK